MREFPKLRRRDPKFEHAANQYQVYTKYCTYCPPVQGVIQEMMCHPRGFQDEISGTWVLALSGTRGLKYPRVPRYSPPNKMAGSLWPRVLGGYCLSSSTYFLSHESALTLLLMAGAPLLTRSIDIMYILRIPGTTYSVDGIVPCVTGTLTYHLLASSRLRWACFLFCYLLVFL